MDERKRGYLSVSESMVALRAIASRLSDEEQEYLVRLVQLLAVPRWRPPPAPPSNIFPSPEYVAKRAAQEQAMRAKAALPLPAAQVVARPPVDSDVASGMSSSMRTTRTEGASGGNESRGARISPAKQRTTPQTAPTTEASGASEAVPAERSFLLDELLFAESAIKLDFKLFSIVAALSQRVASLEYVTSEDTSMTNWLN